MRWDRLRRRLFPGGFPLLEKVEAAEHTGAAPTAPALTGFWTVIVLGPPGSGKGTQAALLSEQLRLPHISTGAILRDRVLVNDDFGQAIAARINVGRFVPDDWINRILDERVSMADCRSGIILDGYPRTVAQAERLLARFEMPDCKTFVVRLEAQAETLVQRFAGRRQCSVCGTLFHLRFQPSLAGDGCDRPGCRGLLIERPDDRAEFVSGRLADFERLTAPVFEYLQRHATGVVRVDAASGSPEEILDRIYEGFENLVAGPHPGAGPRHSEIDRLPIGGPRASSGDRD